MSRLKERGGGRRKGARCFWDTKYSLKKWFKELGIDTDCVRRKEKKRYRKYGKGGGYNPAFDLLDPSERERVAREFPAPHWEVKRRVDGHYKIYHVSTPGVVYRSLERARRFKQELEAWRERQSEQTNNC